MQELEIRKTAALIAAAGRPMNPDQFNPTHQLGEISILQRIITTFQKSGIEEIVVITGYNARKLEKHLSRCGIICLRNDSWRSSDMLASAKIGFAYLQDKCEQLLFTPVDVPMFTVSTVKKLLTAKHSAAVPIVSGKTGHPLLLNSSSLTNIINYHGPDGLHGALAKMDDLAQIEVADSGILFDLQRPNISPDMLAPYVRQPVMPEIHLELHSEKVFLDKEICLLLKLVNRTHSVRTACQQMNLSYSTGWRLLNQMEQQLGFRIIERYPGGKDGGKSLLSERGIALLERYTLMQQQLNSAAQKAFSDIFSDIFPTDA